jgi:hypothetical protein
MKESFEQGKWSFETFTAEEATMTEHIFKQVEGTENETYVIAAAQLFGFASEKVAPIALLEEGSEGTE